MQLRKAIAQMAATTLLPGDLWLAGHPVPRRLQQAPAANPRAGVIVHVKPTGESVSYALDARIWDIAGFLDKTVPGNPASQTLYAVGDGGIYGYHNKNGAKNRQTMEPAWVSPTGEAWAVGSTSIGDERNPISQTGTQMVIGVQSTPRFQPRTPNPARYCRR